METGTGIDTGIGTGTESGSSSAFGTDIGSRSGTDIEGKTDRVPSRYRIGEGRSISFTKTVREVRFECPTIPEKGIVRISLCSSSPSKALDGDDSGHVTVDHDPPGRALPRNRTIYHLSINPSIHLSIDRSIIYHYLCMPIESMSTQCPV